MSAAAWISKGSDICCLTHPEKQAAQTFVHDAFSPRQIAEQWKEIFETVRRIK
jgi:hypothetical protein